MVIFGRFLNENMSIYEYLRVFGVKMIRISSLNFVFDPFNDTVTVHTGHSLLHQVVLTS